MTRQEILDRARAASSDTEEVQKVGYSEAELARSDAALTAIIRLRELRAIWSRDGVK